MVSETAQPRFTLRKGSPLPFEQKAEWISELVWTEARGKVICLCRGSKPSRTVSSQTLSIVTELLQPHVKLTKHFWIPDAI
jgi:hypothetical protein